MAHEIESFAYALELPWHGLGVPLGDELVDSETMIRAASLDWGVYLADNVYASIGNQPYPIETHSAVVRDSDDAILGLVGSRYRPVQNREVFEFAEIFAGEAGVKWETAGSLRGGRVIFVLGKLQKDLRLFDSDAYGKYLLLTNTHDGTRSFTAKFTTVRVVCANTLSAALRGGKDEFRTRHTGDIRNQVEQAREMTGLMQEAYMLLEEELNELTQRAWDRDQHHRFCLEMLSQDPDEKPSSRAMTHVDYLMNAYENGPGQVGLPDSRYKALQAVTDWTSHARTPRLTKKARSVVPDKHRLVKEKKLESLWYGSSHEYAQRAKQMLLADA